MFLNVRTQNQLIFKFNPKIKNLKFKIFVKIFKNKNHARFFNIIVCVFKIFIYNLKFVAMRITEPIITIGALSP